MKHAERRILQKTILLLLSAATIGFIFSNSMETIPESSAKSEELLCVLTPALELFIGKGNATNHLIRKLAHYAEFFVLGTELCLLCSLLKKKVWGLFAGLCTALTDETIQILYERGAQLQDVWLDFSAVVTSAVLVFLCGVITKRGKDRT